MPLSLSSCMIARRKSTKSSYQMISWCMRTRTTNLQEDITLSQTPGRARLLCNAAALLIRGSQGHLGNGLDCTWPARSCTMTMTRACRPNKLIRYPDQSRQHQVCFARYTTVKCIYLADRFFSLVSSFLYLHQWLAGNQKKLKFMTLDSLFY